MESKLLIKIQNVSAPPTPPPNFLMLPSHPHRQLLFWFPPQVNFAYIREFCDESKVHIKSLSLKITWYGRKQHSEIMHQHTVCPWAQNLTFLGLLQDSMGDPFDSLKMVL